jgi:hypothetical protein
MGWLGIQAERYLKNERISVFGGIGYLPAVETGDAAGPAFAGGIRLFTPGSTHRALLEASLSQLLYQEACFEGCNVYYGPGVQAGYQFMSPRGWTVLTSMGVGYALGVPEGEGGLSLMANVGFGYTWRRDRR